MAINTRIFTLKLTDAQLDLLVDTLEFNIEDADGVEGTEEAIRNMQDVVNQLNEQDV